MVQQKKDYFDMAFVFDLKLLCGGYAYFTTFTRYEKFGIRGREI